MYITGIPEYKKIYIDAKSRSFGVNSRDVGIKFRDFGV